MLKRILTAIVLTMFAVYLILTGGWPLVLWVAIFSLIAAYELFRLLKMNDYPQYQYLGYFGIFCLFSGVYFFNIDFTEYIYVLHSLVGGLLLLSLFEVVRKKPVFIKNGFFLTLKIVILTAGTMLYTFLLREGDYGAYTLLFTVLMVGIGDSSALMVGKTFGKHKLSSISPNKTIEGFFGHMFFDLLTAGLFVWISNSMFGQSFEFAQYFIYAVVLSLVCQFGDIHESLNKRFFGVKDSSNLLPGHGGFYDRLDGYLFVMPVMFFMLQYF
ncbi:phosphatidate cytidylyltransferase [bacterium]|jgi:phosphatidate cytidylyltransferase|nr:phosphatidate cytidylyltransferase [bacterium]